MREMKSIEKKVGDISVAALVKNTYNKIAGAYTRRYGNSQFLLKNVDRFAEKLPNGGSVLDVGCGSGRASKLLYEKGFSVVGIDFSEKMLSLARKRVQGASFALMDVRSPSFPDEHFDGVWANFAIIHIPQSETVPTLREWNRVLKPGGVLFITTSAGEHWEGIQDEWLRNGYKMFFHRMSEDALRNYLEKSSFRVEEVGIVPDAPENEDVSILYCFARKKV